MDDAMTDEELTKLAESLNKLLYDGDDLLAASSAILSLMRERDEARRVVRDTLWMAGRYADGRMSYAVGMYNDALLIAEKGGYANNAKEAVDGSSPLWPTLKERATLAETRLEKAVEGLQAAARRFELIAAYDDEMRNGARPSVGAKEARSILSAITEAKGSDAARSDGST